MLILDSWLLSNTSFEKHDAEDIVKIFSCPWNTQLRTYQGDALAKSLYFQFQYAAYELESGQERLNSTDNFDLTITPRPPLNARYYSLRPFRKSAMSLQEKALAVFRGLKFRSTSVASDEALRLAALLDLNVGKIAHTDASARMEAFWELLPVVPFQVLCHEGKSMEKQGLRWTPHSFLYSDSGMARLTGSYQGLAHAEMSAGFKMRWGRRTPRG